MTILFRCSNCQKPLKVKDELAGKKIKCPSCAAAVPVPKATPEPEPEIVTLEEEAPPVTSEAKRSRPVPAELEEVEPAEAIAAAPRAPRQVKPIKDAEPNSAGSKWLPCPRCGTPDPKRVNYTFWGSFYGPKLFNHVRCRECRTAYNGKTGGSNLLPAIGCILIPLTGIVVLLGVIGYILWVRVINPPVIDAPGPRHSQLVRPIEPIFATAHIIPSVWR